MTFALLPQAKSVFLQPPFICGVFTCKMEVVVVLPQGINWIIQVGAYKAAPSPGKYVLPGGSVLPAAPGPLRSRPGWVSVLPLLVPEKELCLHAQLWKWWTPSPSPFPDCAPCLQASS